MKNKFRLTSILRFLLYAHLSLSTSFAISADKPLKAPEPASVTWLQQDLKLNGIGVGVEWAHKNVFFSLGNGFDKPVDYYMTFNYKYADAGYQFAINGIPVSNGSLFRFKRVKYGAKIPIQRSRNGVVEAYTLIFTNLPVLQLNAAKIVDEPKSLGSFRLMSQRFKQDTGVLKMGVEFRGAGTQSYIKKSLGVQIGKATDWTKASDIKLLDLNKDNDWMLNAVYVDTSFFRDLVSYDIFRAIRPGAYIDAHGVARGQASLRGHLIEVIKNGIYDGVYSLNEKPSRKMYDLQKITVPLDTKGLPQWRTVKFSVPENGSVFYKAAAFEDVFYDSASVKANFDQVYPKPKDVVRWNPLVEFANFVATSTDQKFTADIAKKIDLDSVVDWWALVLASHGEDNIKHNFSLAKSGSGKFYLLAWDHEGSFGINWFAFEPDTNNLIKRLTKLPATHFNTKLKARWKALRLTELSQGKMVARFQQYLNESNKGGARARNTARWPERGEENMGTAKYINAYLAQWLPQADKLIAGLPEK
ncbi:CotH kinase family protein [Crenothrix sp.]|uniref:CotH kinase family protein n=1 Tax=Crenothrix sp. TaxID=3100433 RepID=UPI00374DB4B4